MCSSRGSSQLRDETQVSHIAGRFFSSWANREAQMMTAAAAAKSLQSCPTLCNPIDGSPPGSSGQEYWSGVPLPSSGSNSKQSLWLKKKKKKNTGSKPCFLHWQVNSLPINEPTYPHQISYHSFFQHFPLPTLCIFLYCSHLGITIPPCSTNVNLPPNESKIQVSNTLVWR